MGQKDSRLAVPTLRAPHTCEQRGTGHSTHRLLPRAEGQGEGDGDEGRNTGSEPLVSREGDLRPQRRQDTGTAGLREERTGTMRRGIDIHRDGTEIGRHTGSTGVHATMGAYRRQPCMGGGLGRRHMVLPGGMRTRTRAEPGMVQRSCLTCHVDAHQSLRRLQRSGGGDAEDVVPHGDKPHRQLREQCQTGLPRGGREG